MTRPCQCNGTGYVHHPYRPDHNSRTVMQSERCYCNPPAPGTDRWGRTPAQVAQAQADRDWADDLMSAGPVWDDMLREYIHPEPRRIAAE